ncbi:Uncharacterised protein [Mycobacteroides abscessus subsp. abscessus]|nr:Uncharacterised protein [Mycobacteroides abscessus subsp. abscessus]
MMGRTLGSWIELSSTIAKCRSGWASAAALVWSAMLKPIVTVRLHPPCSIELMLGSKSVTAWDSAALVLMP